MKLKAMDLHQFFNPAASRGSQGNWVVGLSHAAWQAMALMLLILAAGTVWAQDAQSTNSSAAYSDPASTNLNASIATLNSVDALDDKYRLVKGDQFSYRWWKTRTTLCR